MEGTWTDKNSWAPIGPGSRRGMNRICNRPIDTPLKKEQFQDELIELKSALAERLPHLITDRMEAHDYQNCLCEIDKYCRVLLNEGKRPKQKYPGGSDA